MRLSIIFLLAILGANVCWGQVTDTLGFEEFYQGTPILYTSPNGGYAFGNNGYEDKAKAQTYVDSVPFVLRGALLEFGAISFNSADSTSVVRVSIYDNHGFGVTSFGQSDSIAPDSVWSYIDIPLYELVGSGQFVEAYFQDTVVIYAGNAFSIGIDMTQMNPMDTVGLMSTSDGDAMGSINAWEYTAGNTWFSVSESAFSWGLDVDLAIFPLIDKQDPAGIDEFGQAGAWLYPNPATDYVSISYDQNIVTLVQVLDSQGKLVLQQVPSEVNGKLDIADWATGIYTVRVVYKEFASVIKLIKL